MKTTNPIPISDKNSPSHQRTISLSDIRLARLTNVTDPQQQQQQQQQLTETVQGAGSLNSTNNTTNLAPGTLITIKQESLASVDNLVGSYVDSTTFLHLPNSQMVNPNLVQNNTLTTDSSSGGGGGVNDGN